MTALLSTIISMSITVDSVGVQQPGFGIPLILSSTATWTERTRFYTSLAGVLVDFASTTPEYAMAAALFSQTVQPAKIAIGRCANKPTQKYSIVPTVVNSTDYKVRVGANTVTYPSDANATNDEITDGLATLINALTGDTTTASTPGGSGSHVLTLTANAAGNYDAVEVLDPSLLAITQDHADPGLAADLGAIAAEDNSWYVILYPFNSKACAIVIATYAEANKKLYFVTTSDSNNATLAIGSDTTTSVMGQFKTSAYKRSIALYHPAPDSFASSAWVGRCAPLDPGSETWSLKTLAGVAAVNMTTTHVTNVEAKNGNHYQSVAGTNMVRNGLASSGQFIDITRFLDWLEATMSAGIFSRLAALDKIPFTDAGVAIVEAEVRAALDAGVAVGGIAADPPYKVSIPKVKSLQTSDKAARLLKDVKFNATLSGAVHKVAIVGVVSI